MKRQLIAAACAIVAWAAPALAESLDTHLFQLNVTVTATNSDGSSGASQSFTVPGGIIDAGSEGDFTLVSSNSPCDLCSGGTTFGTITGLELDVAPDPLVRLKFAVTAGDTDTPFTITSSLVPVAPAYVNPIGVASAAVTVSDDDFNGVATVTGTLPGGKAYEALYNNGLSQFDSLIGPVAVAGPGDTNSVSENSGSQLIPATVHNISSDFQFVLSHDDDASGTSAFQITPEPGSLVLAAIGSVLMLAAGVWRRIGRKG